MDCNLSDMFKKLSVILFFSLFLTSCGKVISSDTGVYTCEQITKNGEMLPVSDFFPTPPVLTLFEGNKALLEINGEECDGIWENAGGEFTLRTGDRTSAGTLESGKCMVDLFGQGIVYGFYNAAFSAPEETEEKKGKNNRWSGEWYGYWELQNTSGAWENLDGQCFDCFAVIDMNMDNSGEITLWDEKSSRSSPLSLVKLTLSLSPGLYGAANSESGFFLSDEIEKGEWEIDPDREELENVLSFSSHYSGTDGAFDYTFILRPWGYVWDDAIDRGNIRLPYHYHQWYLPMLSGNFSMPDSFEP